MMWSKYTCHMSCSGLVTVLALLVAPLGAAGVATARLFGISARATPSSDALRSQQERNVQDVIVDITDSAARSLLVRFAPSPCSRTHTTVL